jgi:hypothetical protein
MAQQVLGGGTFQFNSVDGALIRTPELFSERSSFAMVPIAGSLVYNVGLSVPANLENKTKKKLTSPEN